MSITRKQRNNLQQRIPRPRVGALITLQQLRHRRMLHLHHLHELLELGHGYTQSRCRGPRGSFFTMRTDKFSR